MCKYLHWMDLQGEQSVFTQRPAYANYSRYYVTMGAEFQQPVGARNMSGWAASFSEFVGAQRTRKTFLSCHGTFKLEIELKHIITPNWKRWSQVKRTSFFLLLDSKSHSVTGCCRCNREKEHPSMSMLRESWYEDSGPIYRTLWGNNAKTFVVVDHT